MAKLFYGVRLVKTGQPSPISPAPSVNYEPIFASEGRQLVDDNLYDLENSLLKIKGAIKGALDSEGKLCSVIVGESIFGRIDIRPQVADSGEVPF